MSDLYYQILGVDKNATTEEIKEAYRKKARELHPDKNPSPDAEEQMKLLNEAYSVLKDPEQRKLFDTFGDTKSFGLEDITPADLLASFSGGIIFGFDKSPPKGEKPRINIVIFRVKLSSAHLGADETVYIRYNKICPECNGTGSIDRKVYPICPICNGNGTRGEIRSRFLSPCRDCNKVGYKIPKENVCRKCNGSRLITGSEGVTINVPIGTRPGDYTILEGKGHEFPDKKRGDALIYFDLATPSNAVVDGDDIFYLIKISPKEQRKGCVFTYKGVDGKSVKVMTEPKKPIDINRVKHIPGFGLSSKADPKTRGNLYFAFTVKGAVSSFFTDSYNVIDKLFNDRTHPVVRDAPEEVNDRWKDIIFSRRGSPE